MLDATPSQELNWPRHSHMQDDTKKPGDGGSGWARTTGHLGRLNDMAHRMGRKKHPEKTEAPRKRTIHIPVPPAAVRRSESGHRSIHDTRPYVPLQTPPPAITSPVSRTDTTSADSTVYAVFHHTITDTPPISNHQVSTEERSHDVHVSQGDTAQYSQHQPRSEDPEKGIIEIEHPDTTERKNRWNWQAIASVNPFRRRGRSPPPEVQRGRVIEPLVVDDVPSSVNIPQRNYTGLALRDRLGTLAAQQGEKFRSKTTSGTQDETNLPVTIIPAQPRGRTWSPEILHQDEVSNIAGIQLTPTTSRQTPLADDDRQRPTEDRSSPSAPSRSSHIRFTPETFERPSARQQPESEDTVIPLASSPQPMPATSPQQGDTSARLDTPSSSQPIPTNHDR